MDPKKVHQHLDRNQARILQFEEQFGQLFKLPKNWHFRVYRWLALYRTESLMGDETEITEELILDVCIQLGFEEYFPPWDFRT